MVTERELAWLLISCPQCHAHRGNRCAGPSGRALPRPHVRRVDAGDQHFAAGGR